MVPINSIQWSLPMEFAIVKMFVTTHLQPMLTKTAAHGNVVVCENNFV